jgi:hypothetical protein
MRPMPLFKVTLPTIDAPCGIIPQVVLALAYRTVAHYFYADPFDFMLACACTTFGLVTAGVYMLARTLAGTIVAGLASAAMLLLNFFEVSRVQYHPNLRETWALPFLWTEVLSSAL